MTPLSALTARPESFSALITAVADALTLPLRRPSPEPDLMQQGQTEFVDPAPLREALSELGSRRLRGELSEAAFVDERNRILDPLRMSPILLPCRRKDHPWKSSPPTRNQLQAD